ncbi:MAG: chloride channel protein [Pseudomonadota bacterium]
MERFRHRLASAEALPELVLLALITGFVTGLVSLAFRGAIVLVSSQYLPGGDPEGFEGLAIAERLLLPIGGAVVLGALFTRLPPETLRFGVSRVMERLTRHQGYMSLRTALVQFFGGIIALATGMSGGREGPAIHLGAASASLMGQAIELPNNTIRTLVACGSAAAIAGSFNTPMAGVIFAMEVVMMEYTIGSFIPVIVAAVVATLLTHYFVGSAAAFEVAPLHLNSLLEIPYIVLCGVVVGLFAAAHARLVQLFARWQRWPFWFRALTAAALTSAAAVGAPEVMGVGYDTVDAAMAGDLALATLLAVVVLKAASSAAAVGLGMPVGLIGPTFVVGAALGGALGLVGAELQPGETASTGFYVMLGMAGMMAAVLQAPLAALVAVLELTSNVNVILPAMLIIVVATMIPAVPFRQKPVFLSTLETLGLQYPPSPVTLHLQRAGVASIMSRSFARLPVECTVDQAREALARRPRFIVVELASGQARSVMNAADLRAYLAESAASGDDKVALLRIPAKRRDAADIDYRATIEEAQIALRAPGVEALCVRRTSAPMIAPIRGVIAQEDIDNYRETAL